MPRRVLSPALIALLACGTGVVLSEQQLTDIYAYLLSIPPLVDPKAAAILDH